MSTVSNEPLAINGGSPAVDEPMPPMKRWGKEELARLTEMVDQDSLFYWNGPQTTAMLAEFRKHYPFEHCAPCSSGTAAIHMAVASLNLKIGDEIITTPITDMGTFTGVLVQQCVPVFADLKPHTYNLDPASIEECITPKTKAIIVVHLAGNPADMDAIMAIAKKHSLYVIEDCAQAWGAKYKGTNVGLIGDIGCYSLNDFKHISCGDGGMVCSNNPDIGPTLQMWGDKHYDRKTGTRAPTQLGMNYRMSEPLSAIAAAQLPKMESICNARTRAGTRLSEAIKDLPGIQIPEVDQENNSSYWFYLFRLDLSVLTCTRDEFTKALGAEGVPANAGYLPMAVYRYPVFQDHNFFGGTWPVKDLGLTDMDYTKVNCPVAEEILKTCIFIGIKESMTDSYTDKMAAALSKVACHYAK